MMRALALLLVALAVAGCKPKPTRLDVEPGSLVFHSAGDAAVLQLQLLDAKNRAVTEIPCTFRSSSPGVAEVDHQGTVTAIGPGDAEVAVACDALRATVPVRVSLPKALDLQPQCKVRCKLTPGQPPTLRLEGYGASARIEGKVLDDKGVKVPVELRFEARDVSSSGKGPVAVEVTKEGELRAVRDGRAIVVVQGGAVTGKVNIESVLPQVDVVKAPRAVTLAPGQKLKLAAKAFKRTPKRKLAPVGGARLAWHSTREKVATVSEDGVVTAVAKGATEVIVAADSGAFAQVAVRVGKGGTPPKPKLAKSGKKPSKKRRR